MKRNVYLITLPNGQQRWQWARPAAKDAAWQIVGTVENNDDYEPAPGAAVDDHPHGKPGTYQTWLSVIR